MGTVTTVFCTVTVVTGAAAGVEVELQSVVMGKKSEGLLVRESPRRLASQLDFVAFS